MKQCLFWLWFLILAPVTCLAQDEDWEEYRSQHFFIYYQRAPMDFVLGVADAAEDEYETIAKTLGFTRYEGWNWDRRAKIYIYNDQDHYVNSRNLSWSHGTASTQEKLIRTFPTAHGFFDSTLPHELGHIIFREFIGYKSIIPTWLDEGVAMYQEKAKRWGAHKAVQEAILEEQFIPLKELSYTSLSSSTPRELIELFYAESASIVYFMITELGEYRFVNFCRQLKSGNRLDDAIHRAYSRFRSLDDLNRAWVDYLEQQ